MLKIGLTPCFMYKDPSRVVFGHKNLTYMENDMVDYVAKDSHLPLLIPLLNDKLLEKFLDECDGVVFQGGVDLSPETYGEPFLDKDKWPGDKFRDNYELKVMNLCHQKKIPVLGICRGFQLINAFFKGTLYQDIYTEIETSVKHRCADEYDKINHEVTLENGYLSQLYGKELIKVNSVHHQGIKKLGKDLVLEGVSREDDIIEAYRYKDMDEHYILAIQWHPEFSHTLGEKIDSPAPIIDDFLKHVEIFKNKKMK